jgi:hypothetical protein
MSRPKVFLSFAGMDRPAAKCLDESLRNCGFTTFLDELSIEPGENIVVALNRNLEEADYFVLLWSERTVGNRSVEAEVSAALFRDLDQRRAFVFIVMLDDATLPLLLQPRKYLTFRGDWDVIAKRFAATWSRDEAVNVPVRPAPTRVDTVSPTINLYVRNTDLSMACVVPVSQDTTGAGLLATVRTALALPADVTKFGGQIGARFLYRLELDGRQIPENAALPTLGLGEDSTVDLRIQVTWFAPKDMGGTQTYRNGDEVTLNAAMKRRLIDMAFGHLMPNEGRTNGAARGQ